MRKEIDDRRVRKTKTALRKAMADLLQKKNINDISIQELTGLADVNRGTFYFHYKDIYDFADKLEDEIIHEAEMVFKHFELNQNQKGLAPLLDEIVTLFINAPSGSPLFTKDNNMSIIRKICDTIRDNYVIDWLQSFTKSADKENLYLYSNFLISGYLTLILEWINTENRIPQKQFVAKMERIGMEGIRFLCN